ncbi:MAG: ARMT1-like domain-containing protein [Chlamydiota bacterium]
MKGKLECQPCLLRQALEVARLVSDSEAMHARVLRRILRVLSKTDFRLPPPMIAYYVYRAMGKVTRCPDPYLQTKERSDGMALECAGWAREVIARSKSPLDTALKLAVAANVVDFGVGVRFDLKESLRNVLEKGLHLDESAAFKEALARASMLLYIGDNAGEIVFDKLLLETIGAQYPALKKLFAVRGGPVINDVTQRDAERVKMGEVARVVSTGHAAPGVILNRSSRKFCRAFAGADLVLAKGQGNYESLSAEGGAKVYFLLRAKCQVIARELGVEIGHFVFKGGGARG